MSDADGPPSSSLDAASTDGPDMVQRDNVARKSSPSPHRQDEKPSASPDNVNVDRDEGSTRADSEAETIIQSGRESLSPEKRRKHIHHAAHVSADKGRHGDGLADKESSPNLRKRKRAEEDLRDNEQFVFATKPRSRTSSLSSVVKREGTETTEPVKARRNSLRSLPDSRQNPDAHPRSRKRSPSGSVMDVELTDHDTHNQEHRRRHSTKERERRENTHPTATSTSSVSKNRSVSPSYHSHKRASSGPQQGSSEIRKRKLPAPLANNHRRQSSEDRRSVSSSASASPMPSARSRRLTSEGAHVSSAKPTAHKKQRDQNGRTRLARACAAQEFEAAVARHAERPEDLNVADNAGNTPLQIAALEGCAPIVKFLLDAGCEIDTRNIDKDTPLIDAVENGHLEVVKLLLDAGANPRLGNAEGDEPYDLVPSDTEDYEKIRRIISHAKANPPRKRRSEEHGTSSSAKGSVPRATSGASPRESSPAHMMISPPPGSSTFSRRKTVRSEATRNDLLWTKATPENLCNFAAKGDMAGVANILNVIQKADTESLIAAAKGGHEDVMSLLLGMGDADADPEPVQNSNCKPGFNTPMLAAIGRGNLAIIRLLLEYPGFNPARRLYRGLAYYEIAEDRKGENWEEEVELLKRAYDKYKGMKKARKAEAKSPKRSREQEKSSKKPARQQSSSPVSTLRKPVRSPASSRSVDVGKESIKKRDPSLQRKEKFATTVRQKPTTQDDVLSEHSVDHEICKPKRSLAHRRQSDASTANRGDDVPKRRRLIAGRPPDRDRRRLSLMSTDSVSSREEPPRSHIRVTKDGKEIKDTLEVPVKLKRPRNSVSPERSRSRGSERGRAFEDISQKKKRRLQHEESSRKLVNGTHKKSDESSTEATKVSASRKDHHEIGKNSKDAVSEKRVVRTGEASIPVKQEHKKQDVEELERIPMDENSGKEAEASAVKAKEEMLRKERDARKAQEEEEKKAAEQLEKERVAKEEKAARRAEEQARIAREQGEEEERKRKEVEQRRARQQEEERQRRAEQERLRIAKLRREHEEQEQRRRDALPNRLRISANLVGANDPRAKSHSWLKKFMPVVTARTIQLDSSCGPEVAEEVWVPNFLVAPLLATNDLQLSQYASWEKRQATYTQRLNLWRVTRRILVQGDDMEVPCSSFGEVIQRDGETRPKYFGMEHIFWVKLSDFMDLVPHIPHLNGLDIEFLKMHIDQEPSSHELPDSLDGPKVNGNGYYPSDRHETTATVNGLTNGFGHSRPSTYV
ncbi:histone deacetylase complex subunit (Hos4), putative [Talaromyces stipitatus ATCC 10500]|uniref:Histone deacetylase complex subunit (Hos4), putative n=1 Tax=Talaromyces stipitatus (strain ATCC 10500 / CBS 375.48 / QM 6759 / NRRL 1006) TaxID=441959 RepID=B8M5Y0_TALSN|nr:histone deacetylase complex subunit (Hos4), putative [Talaromyces stipitatus ATCC 10500]EED20107.1 histone deacetylase complex subunit (Hos4), putative [Talaromyces stipitatus ATCC 10500]